MAIGRSIAAVIPENLSEDAQQHKCALLSHYVLLVNNQTAAYVLVLCEVAEDSVLRFHQFVHDTVPITINQRNTSQLLPLLCQTLKKNRSVWNNEIYDDAAPRRTRFSYRKKKSNHFTVKSIQRAAVSHRVNTVCAHESLRTRYSCIIGNIRTGKPEHTVFLPADSVTHL